jgi:hypothetical protein
MRKRVQIQFFVEVFVYIMPRSNHSIDLSFVGIADTLYASYFLEIICHTILYLWVDW